MQNHKPTRLTLSSKHSTQFIVLYSIFSFTKLSQMTKEQQLSKLVVVMQSNYIECILGLYWLCITSQQVVKLVGYILVVQVATTRLGSLKHKAIKAEIQANQQVKQKAINLSSNILFSKILVIVEVSFEKLEKLFVRGNAQVFEHYYVA